VRSACAGLLLLASACSSPSTTTVDGKEAAPPVEPTRDEVDEGCRPATVQGVWARLEAEPCGWELRDDEADGPLVLERLGPGTAEAVRGEPPEACRARTCVYHGDVSPLGPLVLAVVPATDSEMPSDVQLGVVGPEGLAFTSLWEGAGPPVVTDLTSVGPAYALAPFVCGEALALLAVPRLSAGEGTEPPPSLLAREGRIDAGVLDEPAGPVEREACTAVELPVP